MRGKRPDKYALRRRGTKMRELISGLNGLASRRARAAREEYIDTPRGPLRTLWYGAGEDRPYIVDMHSGGFIMMSADADEDMLLYICEKTGFAAVSIDYPLAPEEPWPAALEQVCFASDYIASHPEKFGVDPSRAAICGHSAGANLAATAMLRYGREGRRPFKCAVLDYPVLDMVTDSYDKPICPGAGSRPETLDMYTACYVPDGADPSDPLISPLFAPEGELAALPPTLMTVCGPDPLRPEGMAFASRLSDTGVPVKLYDFVDCDHGFTYRPGAGTAFALDAMCKHLSEYL